jgi:hypothetical protein
VIANHHNLLLGLTDPTHPGLGGVGFPATDLSRLRALNH